MQPDRREFLKFFGVITGGVLGVRPALGSTPHRGETPADAKAVLVDLTICIGCRLCEYACKKSNGFEAGTVESYDDQSVFAQSRRPAVDGYTVVNAWPNPADETKPIYVKSNCLHCARPACVSACIVGALRKTQEGPVTYDAWKCIGCRYCMVACPFQIPAYEYENALTPEVRKCQFCVHRTQEGGEPECVTACPRQAMVHGRRGELLALAKDKIKKTPGRYVDHIYGEHEVGGTNWLYLSSVPFEAIGFPKLPAEAPPDVTEAIQHGVFKFGLPPAMLYGALGGLMYLTRPKKNENTQSNGTSAPAEVHGTSGAIDAAHHEMPMPVNRKLFTPGVLILLALAVTGLIFGIRRLILGLGATTNLDQQHPWGLWIAIDVASGVALAAGGFTTAFLAHVLNREKYHAIVRPALLTALLGYTFVVIGLQADLGRYYNVWHPMIMWQGNSVLFEVGMCVMCYLTVLYLEFAPIACERLMVQDRFPRIKRLAAFAKPRIERIMFLLVIAGCVLSCLHQSSLGNLMVIAPSKLHPLWWTPLSPVLFLLSAIAVGFPMVIWESVVAGWSLKLKPETDVLGALGRFIPLTLGVYLAVKLGDMIWRGTYVYLGDGSLQSACWLIEVIGGVVVPMLMFASGRVRRSPGLMLAAASLVVLGVVLNRVNVFLIGYNPPYASGPYIPSVGEVAVTIGLIAALMLCYRVIVTWFAVIHQPQAKAAT